jgi:hypothetical protein
VFGHPTIEAYSAFVVATVRYPQHPKGDRREICTSNIMWAVMHNSDPIADVGSVPGSTRPSKQHCAKGIADDC